MILHIQNCSGIKNVPTLTEFKRWISTTLRILKAMNRKTELTLRLVTEKESQQLNRQFRGKNKPTNVLSFPATTTEHTSDYLGDLAICVAVVKVEARSQHKTIKSHFAHMIVHGTLHLLGYDHQHKTEASKMEKLEIEILTKLSFENPYE